MKRLLLLLPLLLLPLTGLSQLTVQSISYLTNNISFWGNGIYLNGFTPGYDVPFLQFTDPIGTHGATYQWDPPNLHLYFTPNGTFDLHGDMIVTGNLSVTGTNNALFLTNSVYSSLWATNAPDGHPIASTAMLSWGTNAGGGLYNLQPSDTKVTIGPNSTVISGSPNNYSWPADTGLTISGVINTNFGNSTYGTIAGGVANVLYAANTCTIGGGAANRIFVPGPTAYYSTIPGGLSNVVTKSYTFAAGQQAQGTNQGAFVWADSQAGQYGSHADNTVNMRAAGGFYFDGGPIYGQVLPLLPFYNHFYQSNSVVVGGYLDTCYGSNSFIGGGVGNIIDTNGADVNCCAGLEGAGARSVIAGGSLNYINSVGATIAGGAECRIISPFGYGSAIAGGDTICISGNWSFVGGGVRNTNQAGMSVIGGGSDNLIVGITNAGAGPFARYNTIGGGANNIMSGDAGEYNTISGGFFNVISNYQTLGATIGGGWHNTVIDGGTIPGGAYNVVGYGSLAAGSFAQATNHNSFVWSDGGSNGATPYSASTTNIVQFQAQNGLKLDGGNFQGNGIALTNQVSGPAPVANQCILWYSNTVLYVTGPNSTKPILTGL